MSTTQSRLQSTIAGRDLRAHLHPYTNMPALAASGGPLVITRGSGVWVHDEEGKAYFEGVSGLWCTSLGFSEPRLAKAAYAALNELPYYHNFHNKAARESAVLAHEIMQRAPRGMSKVFFANSGSEANDTAIKLVWYYNNALGRPSKKKIIGRKQGYHGVTIASASITGLAGNHLQFDLPLPGFLHVSSNHHYRHALPDETEQAFSERLAQELDALIQAEGSDTVAAFFAEPMMGAGGVITPPAGYFEAIRKVLDRHDVLLVADEVITCYGRTGQFWGSDTYNVRPDILTCAKAMTSAYIPISAVLLSGKVAEVVVEQTGRLGTFAHGFTYSGHPVAAAVALEVLRIYDERDIVGQAAEVGAHLQAGLRNLAAHRLVGEARGVGMIGAIEIVANKSTRTPFDAECRAGSMGVKFAQDRGLIVRGVGDSLCVAPPLITTKQEIDIMLERLEGALHDMQKHLSSIG